MIDERVVVYILRELCEEKKDLWKKEFMTDDDLNVFNTVMLFLPDELERRIQGIGDGK